MARKTKEKKVSKEIRKFTPAVLRDYDVIIEPVVTEKSMKLLQEQNKITVKVAKDATADQIKASFEAIFNVKVEKINTLNVRPHAKRVGQHSGFVSGYKKAIVKLATGEALDLFKETEA